MLKTKKKMFNLTSVLSLPPDYGTSKNNDYFFSIKVNSNSYNPVICCQTFPISSENNIGQWVIVHPLNIKNKQAGKKKVLQ